jgi:hypothetical protein
MNRDGPQVALTPHSAHTHLIAAGAPASNTTHQRAPRGATARERVAGREHVVAVRLRGADSLKSSQWRRCTLTPSSRPAAWPTRVPRRQTWGATRGKVVAAVSGAVTRHPIAQRRVISAGFEDLHAGEVRMPWVSFFDSSRSHPAAAHAPPGTPAAHPTPHTTSRATPGRSVGVWALPGIGQRAARSARSAGPPPTRARDDGYSRRQGGGAAARPSWSIAGRPDWCASPPHTLALSALLQALGGAGSARPWAS